MSLNNLGTYMFFSQTQIGVSNSQWPKTSFAFRDSVRTDQASWRCTLHRLHRFCWRVNRGKVISNFFSRKPLGRPSWWCQRQGPDKKALQLLQKFFNWERGVEEGEGGEIQSSTIQEILWKCQKRWPGNFILIYDAQTLLLRFIYFEDLKQKKWWSLLHRRPSHQH